MGHLLPGARNSDSRGSVPALVGIGLSLFIGASSAAASPCEHPDLLPEVTTLPGAPFFYGGGPSVARGTDGYALVTRQYPFSRVFFHRVSETGVLLGTTEIVPPGVNDIPLEPVVVATPTGYAVAWCAAGRVLFVAVDPSGAPVSPFLDLPSSCSAGPGLAWNGSEFGLSWLDEQARLVFRRIDAGGTPSGGTTVVSDRPAGEIALAAGQTGFAVAWFGAPPDAPNSISDILFRTLAPDGTPIGAETLLTPGDISGFWPDVIAIGDGYAVAWDAYFVPADVGHTVAGVYLALASPDGVVQAPLQVWMHSPQGGAAPALGWTGSELMMAWGLHSENRRIQMRRISPLGALLGEQVSLTDVEREAWLGRLIWTGSRFAMSWGNEDRQAKFGFVACDCPDADDDSSSLCRGDCDDTAGTVRWDPLESTCRHASLSIL